MSDIIIAIIFGFIAGFLPAGFVGFCVWGICSGLEVNQKIKKAFTIIIPFILIVVIILGFAFDTIPNANSWNDGVCPTCEVKYQPNGHDKGYSYFICPECFQEVRR